MKKAHQEAERNGKQHGMWSVRWLTLGLFCVLLGNLGHLVFLPFADMTLFIVSSSVAILMAGVLSICILDEKFIWKYDVSAAVLITVGSALTVL